MQGWLEQMGYTGKFSPELLQKIKDSVNILDIVGEHVVLRHSGGNHIGLCPFHSERTPSFNVSEAKQVFHCHGCKKGGDLISFLMEILGISFPEALEELAEKAQITLPENVDPKHPEASIKSNENKVLREKQSLFFKLNRFASAYFHQRLQHSTHALDYLSSRGVTETLRNSFYLGFAQNSWESLTQHLIEKKAPLKDALQLGLIRLRKPISNTEKTHYFDLFRNRILFPILNLRGKIAGFGARTLGEESPKYLNSPESLIFQKNKLAYGLYQAQKYIREKNEIILVEGYFDALAMHAAGFKNTVATCGTALSLEHLRVFKRLATKLIVLFDGDQAGIDATTRAMEVGLEAGWVIYGAKMPKGLDPDQLLMSPLSPEIHKENATLLSTEGIANMHQILGESTALLDAKIKEQISLSLKDPESCTQGLKQISQWLSQLKDPLAKEVRIDWVQKHFGVARKLLETEAKKEKTSIFKPEIKIKKTQTEKSMRKSMPDSEKVILKGILQEKECFHYFIHTKTQLPGKLHLSALFDYVPAQKFIEMILSQSQEPEIFETAPEKLLSPEMDPQLQSLITESFLTPSNTSSTSHENFTLLFKEALQKNLIKTWMQFSLEIKTALKQAESKRDFASQLGLMKEYLDVQRKMKDFNNFYYKE